ncbi:hypothetical protein BKA82DRAFT_31086 [Pisolithus tinctorius]|uniref:Uncharacterized protein n=1 Tax=Pisolithus tinctorius Marx 270 TaxID=870435 RepID=A0A0C3NU41_PISTI|nr:hypothetical protein BKA82DRAFT_31086 [Pisolithus tinctorius]KIN98763.1 hypothetical protein M404DRAFT_31086 [Pisolithus tinctorius Marx 270]
MSSCDNRHSTRSSCSPQPSPRHSRRESATCDHGELSAHRGARPDSEAPCSPSPAAQHSTCTVSSGQKRARSPSVASSRASSPERDDHRDKRPRGPFWVCHPQLPFIRHHDSACTTCNAYALHVSQGMALSEAGLTPAIFNLTDKAARIVRHSPYDDMRRCIAYLEDDLNDHDDEIRHLQDKINELRHTFPAPMSVEQEARDFECTRVVSLGGPDHRVLDQPGAGPSTSQTALPAATFVSGGRVQAKPTGSHVSREQPLSQHGWPHHPPTEDVMMTDHAVGFPDVPSDVQMTLDEGAPSVPAQGTMFPEFDGMEWPHRVLSLGKGSDGKNKILFMRINNNLYTYEGKKIDSVKRNLRLRVVPLVPVGKKPYGLKEASWGPSPSSTPQMISASSMRKRYRSQRIRLPASERKSHERREALKEKGKAVRPQGEEEQAPAVGIPPPMSGPSGGAPVLQERIADAPSGSTPASDVGSTPTPALIDHVAVQLHETQQVSEQRPEPSSQAQSSMRTQPPRKAKGAKPSGGKSRGIPELPSNAPPLDSSVEAWREFIDKEQRRPRWGEDGESTLVAMLPGVLGTSSRPDDSDAEADPLSLCNVRGGRYRSLLDWAEVSPVKGASHPWDGEFTTSADRASIAAYLAANRYVNGIIANGGENNPQVMAKIKPLRKALTEPCPPSDVGSREWYERQAQAIGCTINQVPPGHTPLRADDQQIVSAFASAAFIYDLPHCPHGGASTVRGNPPTKDSEPEEGEMTDDLFEDKDRSQM